jgi:transcriptional regulator with XRE-family HTH domain
VSDLIDADRTRTTAATEQQSRVSRTRTTNELVEEVGHLRSATRLLGDDVVETHRRVAAVHHELFEAQLNNRARGIAKRSAIEMLDELAGQGFAWRDIARLAGVSVPAVRRWRQGESPTGPHLLVIARLLAFTNILRVEHLVSDVAAWMEMPLVPEAPLTGMDLAADGRFADLADLAAGHENPEDLLDRWQPGWRGRYDSDFEVFEAADGELGLRSIARDDG